MADFDTQTRQTLEPGDEHPAAADGELRDDGEVTAAIDPAQQSLADALRVSFTVLKVIMVLLLIAYLFTGIFRVTPQQRAVRLVFGKIAGQPGHQVYGPGWHMGLPYPIEQKIMVPVNPRVVRLNTAYWFQVTAADQGKTLDQMQGGPLDPTKDGSLLTGDANIVHARFQLTYRITNPAMFARNVGTVELADEIVRNVGERSIVFTVAQTTADQVIRNRIDTAAAMSRMQHMLDDMHSGISIVVLTMPQSTMPLAVRDAYRAAINAQSERAKLIEQARQQRTSTLNEAAGEAHDALFDLVHAYELARGADDARKAQQLSNQIDQAFDKLQVSTPQGPRPIGGEAAATISQAQTDRTQIVEQVKQEVNTFTSLLAAYQSNPAVVKQRLWQNAKQEILTSKGINDVIYAPTEQINPVIGRDPSIARQRAQQRLKQEQQNVKQESQNQSQ